MKITTTVLVWFSCLAIGLASLAFEAKAASTGAAGNTFQLQLRSIMSGTGAESGPQGWASSYYSRRGATTNQTVRISCRGLAASRVYHLMASSGTNGELVHLSDFMPDRSGAILMHYVAGSSHHFVGTRNPGAAWGLNGGWTNHMSWVIFPGSGSNWCSPMNYQVSGPRRMHDGWSGSGGMGGHDEMGISGGAGTPGATGCGWPAMTDWWSGMGNWSSAMTNWCWDYTNMWSSGYGYGSVSSNWWGSLGRSAYHMMPMPGSLDRVPAINGLVVMDQNLQPVLSADLANPQTFGYQARYRFTNRGIVPGATATLQASATQRLTHFMISATGLAPRSIYYLSVNDSSVTPVATDARGRLSMRQLPSGVTSMRGLGRISILDRNHNTVLSATLPPD